MPRAPRTRTKGGRVAVEGFSPIGDPITILIPAEPVPKARARTFLPKNQLEKCFVQARGNLAAFRALLDKTKHHSFTPDRTASYEQAIAWHASRRMAERRLALLDRAVELEVGFMLSGDPSVWPTDQSDGDLDNLEKAAKDALTGIVYTDDRLVVAVKKIKVCGPAPAVIIRIMDPSPPQGFSFSPN
jgi:Holliday junction resolvase RusA-like endonuclease